DGYSVAVSFRKKNNPGNKGEARLAVRTPENKVAFVTFAGKTSRQFLGFNDPDRGFNYWWWKKGSKHWIDRAALVPEINPTNTPPSFVYGDPRVIFPNEFFAHVSITPKTIIEL